MTLPLKKPFENIRIKGENAGKKHFLIFPQFLFLQFHKKHPIPSPNLNWHLNNSASNLEKSEILLSGKELTLYQTIPTSDEPEKEVF